MADRKSNDIKRPAACFPWRQALVTAGFFALLVLSFGWLDSRSQAVGTGLRCLWVAATGLASAIVGFVLVVCEWLTKRFMRRLGLASAVEVDLGSRF